MYEMAGPIRNLTQIMSRVYPERKWIKERSHDTEKPKLNGVTEIAILTRSITERKPDIRGLGDKENDARRKIHKTNHRFFKMRKFQVARE
jgi:hypothetical protein